MFRLDRVFAVVAMLMFASDVPAEMQAGINALGRGQYEAAIEEFRPHAEQGDPIAQNFLAHTYKLMQKYSESYGWYQLSAKCTQSIDAEVELQILKRKMSPQAIEAGDTLGQALFEKLCVQ